MNTWTIVVATGDEELAARLMTRMTAGWRSFVGTRARTLDELETHLKSERLPAAFIVGPDLHHNDQPGVIARLRPGPKPPMIPLAFVTPPALPFAPEVPPGVIALSDPESGDGEFEPALEPAEMDIQLDRLKRLGGEKFRDKMVALYFEAAAAQSQKMRDADAAGDRSALGKAAHALKSSAGNLGANTVRFLCEGLERPEPGPADPPATVPERLARLADALARAKAHLTARTGVSS